ncbi:uncharacterized protein LOC113282247 [Papaver somniferum]|uniref:uncharacterized protein LOC113282247 n=1 Tax=Papaver somniferum TaxID=3469 RepID=UPI000E6FC76E|nr:uncharacterized protein LOC113282247 [Papaver somniferum]
MEIIPVLSRLNGIEARLQNPSFISRILQNFTGGMTDNISQISNFWTLGALIIAFIATFTKFKLILIRLQKISRKLLLISSSQPSSFLQPSISSDVDDDDETCSSSGSSISSLSDFDSEEEEEYRINDDDQDDFRVAGSSNYEEERGHSFTWSDFANRGKNVVKTWPEGLNLGLGLGLDNSSCSSLVSMLDYGKNNHGSNFGTNSSFFGQSMLSPAVIVSAGLIENSKNVALKVWDTRVGRHIPEIIAEWQPCWKRVLSNGCLNNNSVDLRNVRAPVTDHQSITRWINFDQSDIVNDGDLHDIGNYLAGTNDSVLSRCLSAYFIL